MESSVMEPPHGSLYTRIKLRTAASATITAPSTSTCTFEFFIFLFSFRICILRYDMHKQTICIHKTNENIKKAHANRHTHKTEHISLRWHYPYQVRSEHQFALSQPKNIRHPYLNVYHYITNAPAMQERIVMLM